VNNNKNNNNNNNNNTIKRKEKPLINQFYHNQLVIMERRMDRKVTETILKMVLGN